MTRSIFGRTASLSISKSICQHSNSLSCGQIHLHTPCVYYSPVLWQVSWHFHDHQRNYPPMVEDTCSYVYTSFVLPNYGCKFTFHLICRPPLFIFILCPKFFGIPFLFGLTVLQQFNVLVCKWSNNGGDEKKLSMYNLCPTYSFLAASPVMFACVAVWEGVTCFLSLPKYTVIL